ncbi:ankyrin repeat and fibronectin type III domain containing protein wide awake isoform X3 [Cotesia typhae]|uniref:ankyrin repeat and fibronectin type III domain containing protein wide awake isoform X3 n=1 Tax=Cotesia typhae TaxID=2053667 RepID=UPI003D684B04
MKFRRDINDENIKMELVSHHRTTCSSRISSKKRFKPVRSSVKLMSKLYSQIEVNHSLKSNVGKSTLLDSTKNLSIINNLKVSINVNKVSRDFESKLSLNSDNCRKKELTSDNVILSYKGYENPSFVLDSSFESSITEYLFEPLNDKKEKTDNCETIKLPNGLPKQIENNFSVVADEQCNNQRGFSHKYTQQKGSHNENDNCKRLPINRKNSFSWKTQTNPKCYSQLIDDQHSEISTLIILFAAIEQENLEKVKSILESANVDINSVNSDGFSPLDLAVLGNNKALINILIAHGAREGNQFSSPENLSIHLTSLMQTAEHKLSEASRPESCLATKTTLLETRNITTSLSTMNNFHSGWTDDTNSKQTALWERRVRTLRKMLADFDQARPPDIPRTVSLEIIGSQSVIVKFEESTKKSSSACTKFKVQWSTKKNFSVITGELEIFDIRQRQCQIDNLVQGQKYFFRICLGNLKGYSQFLPSSPPCAVPSSWRDIDERLPRYTDQLERLNLLLIEMQRPEYTKESSASQRRNNKKKTIKQLFSATSKFQKNLKRGIYLACILYHEDKVLVTNEDFLPVIQIDETYPNCIYNDFYWLMKVSYIWNNLKTLKQDMEKNYESSINHFKLKYLQAAVQMQAALGIQNLGEIYYMPIKDSQGTVVISTINHITCPKSVSLLNCRWLPISKVMKKTIIHEESNVSDILISSIQNKITYHQLSSIKLNRGLYLGYLKMQSSVDLIQIVVPAKTPNVLPYCKIRDNPFVSAEEWNHLKKVIHTSVSGSTVKVCVAEEEKDSSNESSTVDQGKLFVETVAIAVNQLFSYMGIDFQDFETHRLYDAEIIELTEDVSFLIVVPPVENVCLVPGTRDIFLQRGDLLTLPIQIFEMVQLNAYQKNIIDCYSKLSCILELEIVQAQHKHREAFSSTEVSAAKDKLTKLQELQSQMNDIWKGARWLIDVITFSRDRGFSQSVQRNNSGITLKYLLNVNQGNESNAQCSKRILLQLPAKDTKSVKTNPNRGSWPGLNTSNNLCATELSKSEQHLLQEDIVNDDTTYMSNVSQTANDEGSGSKDCSKSFASTKSIKSSSSTYLSGTTIAMSSSKSEDILSLDRHKHNRSGLRNNFTIVKSISADINPQLGEKSTTYERTMKDISIDSAANTTTSLSVKSLNSDSIHLPYTDNSSAISHPIRSHISTVHTKSEVLKSTASVAATASISMDSRLDELKDQSTVLPVPPPGILQVYVAYETGLASGTSLKLHVTPRTTAREVVDLVVKQLNMAVVLKGQEGPIYSAEELPNFCLVAVIGARERCLRDDFKPLQLQNPWKKGRLYVRQKQDVLAALEHSSKHLAYL